MESGTITVHRKDSGNTFTCKKCSLGYLSQRAFYPELWWAHNVIDKKLRMQPKSIAELVRTLNIVAETKGTGKYYTEEK